MKSRDVVPKKVLGWGEGGHKSTEYHKIYYYLYLGRIGGSHKGQGVCSPCRYWRHPFGRHAAIWLFHFFLADYVVNVIKVENIITFLSLKVILTYSYISIFPELWLSS